MNNFGSFLRVSFYNMVLYIFSGTAGILFYIYCIESNDSTSTILNKFLHSVSYKHLLTSDVIFIIIFIIISMLVGLILTSVGNFIVDTYILEAPSLNKKKTPISFVYPCKKNTTNDNNILYMKDIIKALNEGKIAGELSEIYFATYNVFVSLGTIGIIAFFYNLLIVLNNNIIMSLIIGVVVSFLAFGYVKHIVWFDCVVRFHPRFLKRLTISRIKSQGINKKSIKKFCFYLIYLCLINLINNKFTKFIILSLLVISFILSFLQPVKSNTFPLLFDLLFTIFTFTRGIEYYKQFADQIDKTISKIIKP